MKYLKSYYHHHFGRHTKIPFDEVPDDQLEIIANSLEFKNYIEFMDSVKTFSLMIKTLGMTAVKFSQILKDSATKIEFLKTADCPTINKPQFLIRAKEYIVFPPNSPTE